MYGVDSEAPLPPAGLNDEDTEQLQGEVNDEVESGVLVNGDEELAEIREMLNDMKLDRDDGNWGIEIYCEAVLLLLSRMEAQS
jgi:hypothetical protein